MIRLEYEAKLWTARRYDATIRLSYEAIYMATGRLAGHDVGCSTDA